MPWYFNGDSFETNLGTSGDNIEPGGRELIDGLEENITFLINNSKKLILIYPIPSFKFDVTKRIMSEIPKGTLNSAEYLNKNPFFVKLAIVFSTFVHHTDFVFRCTNFKSFGIKERFSAFMTIF